MKDFRAIVCVPSNGGWESDMAQSLAGMMAHFTRQIPGYAPQQMQLLSKKGSILPQLRQRAINAAQQAKATHLLFIDSDMTFPADTMHRLVAADRPIVAANCATKMLPSSPTARLKNDHKTAGDLVYSHDKRGLQRVWRVGTGIMLIRMSAIAHIPAPHFGITWVDELQDHQGEDWFFCALMEKHGIPIMVDHDLSRNIGHVGRYTYTHDDIATAVAMKEFNLPEVDEAQLQLAI